MRRFRVSESSAAFQGTVPSHFSRIWTVSPISSGRPCWTVPRKLASTEENRHNAHVSASLDAACLVPELIGNTRRWIDTPFITRVTQRGYALASLELANNVLRVIGRVQWRSGVIRLLIIQEAQKLKKKQMKLCVNMWLISILLASY